jgi:RNA polymerase sigma factor (sigma-70 family)
METPGLRGSSLAATSFAEGDLIARAQKGDEAAFEEIFERYKRRVFAFCLRLTRVPADAEDLTQEVFLLLFRKISTFRGESAFSTWLHRMVANVDFMHLRKKTRPPVSLDDEGTSLDEPVRREIAEACCPYHVRQFLSCHRHFPAEILNRSFIRQIHKFE